MFVIISIVAVITAILLTFIVLIQESKGGGLASGFASSNQVMGVRKTTDFIEKATWTLAGVLVLLSVISTYVVPRPEDADQQITNIKQTAPTAPTAPSAPQNNSQAPAQQ